MAPPVQTTGILLIFGNRIIQFIEAKKSQDNNSCTFFRFENIGMGKTYKVSASCYFINLPLSASASIGSNVLIDSNTL